MLHLFLFHLRLGGREDNAVLHKLYEIAQGYVADATRAAGIEFGEDPVERPLIYLEACIEKKIAATARGIKCRDCRFIRR